MANSAHVYVVGSPKGTDERCLKALAEFLGLEVRAPGEPVENEAPQEAIHIAATCQSLRTFHSQPSGQAWLARHLAVKGSSLFMTGIAGSPEDVATIASVLPGVVDSVQGVGTRAAAYEIPRHASNGMPQLAGLGFGPAHSTDGVFVLGKAAGGAEELIRIDRKPCFVKIDRHGASYFLLACSHVLDIDTSAPLGVQPIDRFLQFAPFLAYLRLIFGPRCWTNEKAAACLIIDDPLLRNRYGFLDFNGLDSRLKQSQFSINIAFIPWNCRRTDPQIVERFRRPDRRFSVSVHGCDHTRAEFGSRDEQWLRRQARLALSRMQLHEELTGIKHNRVMVFPQGEFSKASLRVLGDEGFLAAVNSTIRPADATPGEITFRDLLAVAVERFGGAPLFLRHYPDRLEKIALDLFLGRQALMVEHHKFFQRGYDEAERCIAFVNQVAPGIRWTDLEDLCASACLVREVSDRCMHVRAFGSVLRLKNYRNDRKRFRVEKICAPGEVEMITWNGHVVDFQTNATTAVCDLILDPGEEGVLSYHRAATDAQIEDLAPTVMNRFKVFARRRLCEVRDNYLERSRILSGLARVGKELLPRV